MDGNNDAAARIRRELAQLQGRETYDPNQALPGNQQSSGGESNPLMDLLTERLTQQASGISSSGTSNIQDTINQAIDDTQRAGQLGSEALQIERQRELGFAQDRAGAQITGALEGRTGYATQVVALRELTETTEKSIRDLDQRYQQAIMQNDAATAQRVADLKMQKLEYLEEKEQQFYNNMFSLANLQQAERGQQQQMEMFERGLSAEERRFQEQLGFDLTMFEKQTAREERSQVMQLAAEYGVPVSDNETIESMINKVSPFVDEERRLRLEEIRSGIAANRASTAASLRRVEEGQPLDEVALDAMAIAYIMGDTALLQGSLKNPEQYQQLQVRISQYRSNTEANLKAIAEAVGSQEEFIEAVREAPDTFADQADIQKYIEIYNPQWSEGKGFTDGVANATNSVKTWINERVERSRGNLLSRDN